MPQDIILEAHHLSKTYGAFRAVDDISFFLREGEILGMLGPNGAGKTTTIDMILGIVEPTAGAIRIFGKYFGADRAAILQKVNFAAVYADLPGNLTVWQNLYIAAHLYGISSACKKIKELLEEFDLERFAKTKTGLLSSGEKSRLNLAKSLLNDPKLLLMDEPTASLDPSASEMVRTRIARYAKEEHAAVVWTSHDMYEIEAVCDRALFISHGKIILEGNPRELPTQYGKKNLEELFIAIAREPLSITTQK